MMDNILYIVPYTAQHGQFILYQQMNHKVLEADKHYNNVDGPYGENCVIDRRPHLGLPSHFKQQDKMDAMREADRKLNEQRNNQSRKDKSSIS